MNRSMFLKNAEPKKSSLKHDEKIARLVSLPAVLLVVFMIAVPFAIILIQSFREIGYGSLLGEKFIGLQNYINSFKDEHFRYSLFVTLVFSVCTVIFTYVIGFLTAVFLNTRFLLKKVIFTLCLLPWAMPLVPTGLIWKWMLHNTYGVLNWFLVEIGLSSDLLNWFANPWLSLIAIVFVNVWRQYPITLLMIYAALQTIPQDHYDVGRVAGINRWQEIRFIVFPGVRAVSFTIMILQLLTSFRAVTSIYVLTGGGPSRSTETLALHTFIEAFEFYKFGKAASAGVLTLLIVFVIVLIFNHYNKKANI